MQTTTTQAAKDREALKRSLISSGAAILRDFGDQSVIASEWRRLADAMNYIRAGDRVYIRHNGDWRRTMI